MADILIANNWAVVIKLSLTAIVSNDFLCLFDFSLVFVVFNMWTLYILGILFGCFMFLFYGPKFNTEIEGAKKENEK